MILFFSIFTFSISYYATTSNEDSVYIIGGFDGPSDYTDVIAQYKDGAWFNLGNLAQRKHAHGAITFTHFSESITMIIGGRTGGNSG